EGRDRQRLDRVHGCDVTVRREQTPSSGCLTTLRHKQGNAAKAAAEERAAGRKSGACPIHWRRSLRPEPFSAPNGVREDAGDETAPERRLTGVRTFHRSSPKGGRAGAGKSAPAPPPPPRHRAHPARAHPRG